MTDDARIAALQEKIAALQARIKDAEDEIEQIRFRDVPRYAKDTVVLAPWTMFGKRRLYPAKILTVHLDYRAGTLRSGESYEHKLVTYSVLFRKPDGTFSDTTESVRHEDVQPLPEVAEVLGADAAPGRYEGGCGAGCF